jgi:hypothetical protein
VSISNRRGLLSGLLVKRREIERGRDPFVEGVGIGWSPQEIRTHLDGRFRTARFEDRATVASTHVAVQETVWGRLEGLKEVHGDTLGV